MVGVPNARIEIGLGRYDDAPSVTSDHGVEAGEEPNVGDWVGQGAGREIDQRRELPPETIRQRAKNYE